MKNTGKKKVTMKQFKELICFYRGVEFMASIIFGFIALSFIIYDIYFYFCISTSYYDDSNIIWTIYPILISIFAIIIMHIIDYRLVNKYKIRKEYLKRKEFEENYHLRQFRDQIEKDLEGIDFAIKMLDLEDE